MITLRPYQRASVDRMVNDKVHFLFYKMGLGKTPTTITAAYEAGCKSILILCPKNALRTWEDHFKQMYPDLDQTHGNRTTHFSIHRVRKKSITATERRTIWNTRVSESVNVYIFTYNAFVRDLPFMKVVFDAVILDECKRIRNRKSEAFKALKGPCKRATYFWPMTGTPGKMPIDVWTLFHLFSPKLFGSFWKFAETFQYVQNNGFNGKEIFGLKNPDSWYRLLRSRASLVTKEMVRDQIGAGEKIRQILTIEMDECQAAIYKQFDESMLAFTGDQLILLPNTLSRIMRFRQLLVCPKILDPSLSYGAALEDLVETLEDIDPHVVIFTPFTAAIPFIKERLRQAGHQHIIRLQGGITPDEQMDRIQYFKDSKGIAICSIKYAESFPLEPAQAAFFLGYEFEVDANEQAEDRLVRFTTEHLVNIYYYAYQDTYDDRMIEIVTIKDDQRSNTFDSTKAGLKF